MLNNHLNKRNFIIYLKETQINPDIKLNNLSGENRTDLVCRVISSTFFLSNSFRKDTNLFLFFQRDSIVIVLFGDKLTSLSPDERSIGGYLKSVFKNMYKVKSNSYNLGYAWYNVSNEDIPISFENGYVLDSEGIFVDIIQNKSETKKNFILGDHLGLNENDKSILTNYTKISLGTKELHSSSCITIIHHYLDR